MNRLASRVSLMVVIAPWTTEMPSICGRVSTRHRRNSTLPLRHKTDPGIGPRLRHLRLQKGYTVEALAAAAGLNKGFLSRLERGTKRPSIETILRLSAALEVPVGQLFGDQTSDDTVRLSRAAGRSRALEDPGIYSFELLTPKGSLMEAFLFHVGTDPTGNGQRHDGEEMFLVLGGTVEMRTPDRTYVLEQGDCAYFPGHLAHQMRRLGSEPATAVIAVARDRAPARRNQTSADMLRPATPGRQQIYSAVTENGHERHDDHKPNRGHYRR
jgi:transcriptional regulator with XRE-family HTH domain